MRFLPVLFLLLCATVASAQLDAPTERSVKQQSQFIEAKQAALLGKTEDAIARFTELAGKDPDNDAIQFELGRLKYAASDTEAAITHLRRAYALRPNTIYAAFLAELYQASGRYKDGAELYAGLIKRNPAEESFYLERAAFQVRAQDVKGAVATYNQLEDRIGVNVELARHKHALYLGQGDQKRAEKELLTLVESQPDNTRYRHMLAGYYVSQDEKGKARRAYEEILRVQPADVRAQLALQDVNPNKPPAAGNDDALMTLLARPDVDLDLKIGKLLPLVNQVARTRDAGEGQRAVALAAELRRVHPDEAKAAALQGDVYFHTGQLADAADAYRTTLELDDTVYPVWEQLLATLYLDNQTLELRKYAENALDVYPNRPAVYVHYAIAEAFRADFAEANNLLEQAQLMTAGQPKAVAALAELTKAIAALSTKSAPAGIDQKLLPGGPTGPLAFLLTNREDATALTGYDDAANTNALFLEWLGDARARAGDKAGAATAYARAKAAGSKSSGLRKKLADVQ